MDLILLALVLVILQRVLDWCLHALLSSFGGFRRREQQVLVPQSVEVSKTRICNGVLTEVSGVRKFYAVRQGFNPGLYYSWTDCEREVKGFSKAEFRSFRSQEDAERYLRST